MNILVFFTCFFAIFLSNAKEKTTFQEKPIIVAVIDTGFDFNSTWKGHLSKKDSDGYQLKKPKICKQGHADFTEEGIKDTHGHGTHIAGVIAKFAEDSNYCLVILKYYKISQFDNTSLSIKALQKAIDLKVSIINYSGGGMEKSDTECNLIKQALNMGIHVIAAAGNESFNINQRPYYPAMCDDRVIIVSSSDDFGNNSSFTNFTDKKKNSRELVREKGLEILSILPNNKIGVMSGTSQATSTYTGKLIKKMKMK